MGYKRIQIGYYENETLRLLDHLMMRISVVICCIYNIIVLIAYSKLLKTLGTTFIYQPNAYNLTIVLLFFGVSICLLLTGLYGILTYQRKQGCYRLDDEGIHIKWWLFPEKCVPWDAIEEIFIIYERMGRPGGFRLPCLCIVRKGKRIKYKDSYYGAILFFLIGITYTEERFDEIKGYYKKDVIDRRKLYWYEGSEFLEDYYYRLQKKGKSPVIEETWGDVKGVR